MRKHKIYNSLTNPLNGLVKTNYLLNLTPFLLLLEVTNKLNYNPIIVRFIMPVILKIYSSFIEFVNFYLQTSIYILYHAEIIKENL